MADDGKKTLSRRSALGWIAVAAPAIATLGGGTPFAAEKTPGEAAPDPPKLSEQGKFIAKNEAGLSGAERKRLRKQLPGFEGALRKLRDFELPDDVEPAVRFQALRSERSGR